MTIIIPVSKPLYWAIEKPPVVTGFTPIGGLTISGEVLVSDADPKAFLTKIASFQVAKALPTDEVGSVYKDAQNKICLVKEDKTIEVSAVAVEAKPTEENPIGEVKIIK